MAHNRFIANARKMYRTGHERDSWCWLLLNEYYGGKPPKSMRVAKQQKLWQQRGTLERTRVNLRDIGRNYSYMTTDQRSKLFTALQVINDVISVNMSMNAMLKYIPVEAK